ncbi:MAG: hypothetical protein KKG09_00770 [Verrucomicrobia bacterium]|nr:hypothetical protein [Verrucomicrobiota bacterium]MBU4247861.1 hypothetical protein [Verrucomicrobiota bacterium]MBU4290856.1 hypothetical protein [Verrucomicrobiota bacterium]MBU4496524.1 hypothetical protein [Verrucomicrobiota bacterium]MCG2681238.1 hypothetical protein [Kiritimatiellia bacterium]
MTESQQYSNREAQAMAEVGRTTIRPALARLLTFVFLFGIAIISVTQQITDIRAYHAGRRSSPLPQCYDIFRKPPGVGEALTRTGLPLRRRIVEANRCLMRAMHAYEDQLENDSVIGGLIRAPTQALMASRLGAGNEQVYCGAQAWLFYRPDIEYLAGPGFLEPKQLARRIAGAGEWQAPPQPDPVRAILQFRDQLARRGIALIVMPAPAKPTIHPEQFTRAYAAWPAPLQNQSYARFLTDLRQAGVPTFDIARELVLIKNQTGQYQYLATDTHWRPEAMEYTARQLKVFIEKQVPLPPAPGPGFKSRPVTISHSGDLALMLKMPEGQESYPPETVTVRQVFAPNGDFWRPDSASDVLVLGDSFCNIYSLDALGWGDSAGLIEQLSYELQRPLDRIALNDKGAFAARTALGRELARGRDRLAGKRLVIYEFAARELTEGDWKLTDLSLGKPPAPHFLVPPAGATWKARGMVKDISLVPRPGSVPYKDHVLSLHLVDIECRAAAMTHGQAVVYMRSMRDNVWTPAARLRPGDMIEVRIRPWSDVASHYERINRTDPDDPELQLQDPCWSEEASPIRE